jgi:transposase
MFTSAGGACSPGWPGAYVVVEAGHFVQGAYLGCLWCLRRLFIRGAFGRQRYSVLGALNAVTNELVRITTAGTETSQTMCDLLRQIAALGLTGPYPEAIRLVLDNAHNQHCAGVKALAATLHIELQFLPSYSPNLNLIERLWKFVKRDVLYGRYYNNFCEFCRAIDGCLDNIPPQLRVSLATLMTHHFQRFDPASFLTA